MNTTTTPTARTSRTSRTSRASRASRSSTQRTRISGLRRTLATSVVAIGAMAGFAACGSDDSGSARLPSEACDAVVTLDAAMAQAPQDPAEIAGFVQDSLMGPVMTLTAQLDGDAQDAAETIHRTLEGVVESGDPSAMNAPETLEAQAKIGALVHDRCGMQSVDLVAKEYEYQGAPDALKPGLTSFELANRGVEEHEMVLLRRNDGVTESLEEILQLPQEEAFGKVTFTGVTFGGPDTTHYTTADLQPGTYYLVCFIPVGGAEDAPPHFMSGMQHTIVVA